ncbi:MAG TPA: Gfo/Idh/MocA family oxidoreductase [Candidatus Limnocylindrales bacterium]|nr:Gfo/Idh/MocA family oxidoreductase [Candidatus Limnocylindrales bacterium]
MTTEGRLGVALVGAGDIAERYAADVPKQPSLRLLGVTDLDETRANRLAAVHRVRAYPSLDDLLADEEVAIVVNLTSHRAHVPVTRAALEARRHVFSEKPLALDPADAHELVATARDRGVRLGAAPSVLLGEMAATAREWISSGRLGSVRLAYADVNWGRIETWHDSPEGFYDVGPLYDVGVYPLTLLTGLLGPARRVTAAGGRLLEERRTKAGGTFRIGAPDAVVAAIELESGALVRLTADFYVADPARQRGVELHGDEGSLWLSNWFRFRGSVEAAVPWGSPYAEVPLIREPVDDMPWAAGAEELARAVIEDRPMRAAGGEHAAHVVDVLGAIMTSIDEGRAIDLEPGRRVSPEAHRA